MNPPAPAAEAPAASPSPLRAWLYLIRLSLRRQARARMMLWVALGLLLLFAFLVHVQQRRGRFGMEHWRSPPRRGITYGQYLNTVDLAKMVPLDAATRGVVEAASGTWNVVVREASGFFVFSNWVVFSVFATFLLPLWTLSFATEGLGGEREARNLLWVLTRPLPRSAIYLGKFLAVLPWCLGLNLGGFWLLCRLAGWPGELAFRLYAWAVVWGTLAFAALFFLMGAWSKRAAVMALLYAFFLETIAGNLPGHFKRLSLSFYMRCLMFDSAHDYGVRPERPAIYLPVDGTTAAWVLGTATLGFLGLGLVLFSRQEYLE